MSGSESYGLGGQGSSGMSAEELVDCESVVILDKLGMYHAK